MPLIRNFVRTLTSVALAAALAGVGARSGSAEALLLVQADNGRVLHAENATYPWHPASLTKLMTAYVTLHAVRDGRIKLDTPFTVSANAAAQQPTKMGFRPGIQVTVDNALKMMMVKSANDMAVMLAEGVAGSTEAFAEEMNRAAQQLGMTQSNYVNPNGLPEDNQITSARDLAILARALIYEFPEYDLYWHIPAIRLGRRVLRNHNALIGRYPGADGMKTGFICASGFNLVATATRDDKRLIAIVLGAPSSSVRAEQAVRLFEKGFHPSGLTSFLPFHLALNSLVPLAVQPIDLHERICGPHKRRPASEEDEDEPSDADDSDASSMHTELSRESSEKAALGPLVQSTPPIEVFVGATKKRSQPQLASSHAKPVRPEAAAGSRSVTRHRATPASVQPAASPGT